MRLAQQLKHSESYDKYGHPEHQQAKKMLNVRFVCLMSPYTVGITFGNKD